MPFGSAINTASYNGFTFSAHMETMGVEGRPRYDEAERTVTHVVYTIRIKDRLYDTTDTDTAFENVRRKLSAPGKELVYTDHGFGDFSLNTSTIKDLKWGPKPRIISWMPVGGQRACEFVWEVEVAVSECDQASSTFTIMEFNYQLSFEHDISGYTTRTYAGHLIIPQTRQSGGRSLQDSADRYWERIQPAVPDSFRRVRRERTIDKSKSRLDFIIADEEIGPNFFPPGAVDAKLSHSLTSDNRAFVKWIGNVQAEYEVDRAFPRSMAYNHFVDFLNRRLRLSRASCVGFSKGTNQPETTLGFILPCRFSLKENEAYGRAISSFSFDYILYQPLSNILKASALWTPLGNDYYQWKSSLKNKSQHPRGNARLEFNTADDAIVDLCLGSQSVTFTDPKTEFAGDSGGQGTGTMGGSPTTTATSGTDDQVVFSSAVFGADPPTVNESWMHYEMTLEAGSTSYVMEHKPLPVANQAVIPPPPKKYNPAYVIEKGRASPPSRIQYLNSNDNSITLIGKAIRCGFDIPRPRLVKIGNRQPVEQNRDGIEFFRTQILTSFAFPVVVATFRLRWIVPNADGPLGTMLAPSTPLLHRPDFIPPDGQQLEEPL